MAHNTNARQLTCTIKNLTRRPTHEVKNHTWIDILEIEMTLISSHMPLRWYFKRKYGCQLTSIFVYENFMWYFGFESWMSKGICQTYKLIRSENKIGALHLYKSLAYLKTIAKLYFISHRFFPQKNLHIVISSTYGFRTVRWKEYVDL